MLNQLKDLEGYNPKNSDKRNSRKETLINAKKLCNNRNNVIKASENEVFPFKDGFGKKESDMSDKALPDQVKVDKKRFNVIKNEIQQVKNKNLQARPNRGSPIYFDESYKLIQDIQHSNITHEEELKIITDIRKNIERLHDLNEFNPNQVKVLNALFMVNENFTGEFKWQKLSDTEYTLLRSKSDQKESNIAKQRFAEQPNEQPDTTDMPELESEGYAEQRGQRLKFLTPSPMLSRLSISLAQLNAGNNSEKPKSEIRQLLYSLYRSKQLTKQIYKSLIDII